METLRPQFARAACVGSAIILAVAAWLGLVSMARSQVTSAELKLLDKLPAEPHGKPAFDKRLPLIADALERLGDPKRRLRSSYGIDMRRPHPSRRRRPLSTEVLGPSGGSDETGSHAHARRL